MAREKIRGSGIFQTWLDYCEVSNGESRARVIRRVNQTCGLAYTNARFHNYLVGIRPLPPTLFAQINGDLAGMYAYLINDLKQGPVAIAESMQLPIKNNHAAE
jgi:hypothetical protein